MSTSIESASAVRGSPSPLRPPATAPSVTKLIWILALLAALGPFTIDMYLPSFPDIARSLGVEVAAVELTVATYLAGLAIGNLIYGPLADRFGRRRPLLLGLGIYSLTSLLCAAAPNLPLLAAGRLLQGIGGAAGMVISRAVVRDRFNESESARIYSALMLIMGVAPIVAPLLGGQLVGVGPGWPLIFLILTVLGASVWTMIARLLPESLPVEARTRRSPVETIRTMGATLRQLRFVRLALAGGAIQASMFAYIAGSPFVFIELFGIPQEHYGFYFGANALGFISMSQLNRWMVPRFGVQPTMRAAIFVATAAYTALWFAGNGGAGPMILLPLMFVGIASIGCVLPNATAAAMAPFDRSAGVASSLLGTIQVACGALAAMSVSLLADGSARPMFTVMFGCSLVSVAVIAPDLWSRARAVAPSRAA